jgi:hypothetical protein
MLIDAGAGTSLGADDGAGEGAVVGAVELHPAMREVLHRIAANRFFIW